MIKKALILAFIVPFLFSALLMCSYMIRGYYHDDIKLEYSTKESSVIGIVHESEKSILNINSGSSNTDKIIAAIIFTAVAAISIGLVAMCISVIKDRSNQSLKGRM